MMPAPFPPLPPPTPYHTTAAPYHTSSSPTTPTRRTPAHTPAAHHDHNPAAPPSSSTHPPPTASAPIPVASLQRNPHPQPGPSSSLTAANIHYLAPSPQPPPGSSPGSGTVSSDVNSNEAEGGHSAAAYHTSPSTYSPPQHSSHSPFRQPTHQNQAMEASFGQSDSSALSHSSSSNHNTNGDSHPRPPIAASSSRRTSIDRPRPSLSTDASTMAFGPPSSSGHSTNPGLPTNATTPGSANLPSSVAAATFPFPNNRSPSYLGPLQQSSPGAAGGGQKVSPSLAGGLSSHNNAATVDASNAGTVGASPSPWIDVVPTTFDEATLRALCDTDIGVPLLYERIKQSMTSCREAASFFKKRGLAEEEYGRLLQKSYKSSLESYGSVDGKAGTYVTSWHSILATHEHLAEGRIKFGQRLGETSEELTNLVKEIDRNRKSARETAQRLEKALMDAETSVEKARARFESAAEELERVLLLKSGESTKGGELAAQHASSHVSQAASKGRSLGKAMTKGGMLFNKKNPQQLLRQEDDIRSRTSQLSDSFRREVLQTQQMRQEYFNLQLPRILRTLKETAEEIDNGLQYHLSRYAFLYETTVLGDGMTVTPVGTAAASVSEGGGGQTGLKQAAEAIDNRTDFKTYMQNYQVLHGRDYKGPKREGAYEDGNVPGLNNGGTGSAGSGPSSGMTNSASSYQLINNGGMGRGYSQQASSSSIGAGGSTTSMSSRQIFGVELDVQMARDNVDVPGILEKCAQAVETFGKENMGIYRLSGTTSKVQRLKAKFDADWTAVDLFEDAEALGDINIVSGCLKLWFRELPEPLLTWELYRGFIEAAKVENDRLRHIRLHEVVNQLPDANYSTLKALMCHLDRVRAEESVNQMGASNLAIVFGPTLLGPPPPGHALENNNNNNNDGLEEMPISMAGLGIDSGEHPSSSATAAAVAGGGSSALADMQYQAKAIETILVHYKDIFLEDDEVEEEERARALAKEQQEAALLHHSQSQA